MRAIHLVIWLLPCLMAAEPHATGSRACLDPDGFCPSNEGTRAWTDEEVEVHEESEATDASVQLLQATERITKSRHRAGLQSQAHHGQHSAQDQLDGDQKKITRSAQDLRSLNKTRDLIFQHVPCNFGHTVERAALAGTSIDSAMKAYSAPSGSEALAAMEGVVGTGGELWGMLYAPTREISNVTGCNIYYTPPKHWPAELARRYFGKKTVFGILRDPYDKFTNVFRQQVRGMDSLFTWQNRQMVSSREGKLERESDQYLRWYRECDVNAFLKAELTRVKAGDLYRVNCQLLSQAEYFDPPYGITIPIDNRKIPGSFNELMAGHGYDAIHMDNYFIHNEVCNNVSAYSLNAEVKQMIREIYARDFELLCKHFGYCNREELTCLEQVPDMCGSKP